MRFFVWLRLPVASRRFCPCRRSRIRFYSAVFHRLRCGVRALLSLIPRFDTVPWPPASVSSRTFFTGCLWEVCTCAGVCAPQEVTEVTRKSQEIISKTGASFLKNAQENPSAVILSQVNGKENPSALKRGGICAKISGKRRPDSRDARLPEPPEQAGAGGTGSGRKGRSRWSNRSSRNSRNKPERRSSRNSRRNIERVNCRKRERAERKR